MLCRGNIIETQHLPPEMRRPDGGQPQTSSRGMTLREMESVLISDSLRRNAGNRTAAAKELGIHPSTLFRKIKDLRIETPDRDGRSRTG